jgi:cellulose synthase/poly-beta-1,6-N-acetylglucosamine synthase-like glycosyltransferase
METLGSTGHISEAPPPHGPRLSVIVPVRDGARFLVESLPALRASDLPSEAGELIVVDDASRDGSADVAERFADLVVRRPESSGPAAALNHGVRQSSGDTLVFIDADVSGSWDALRCLEESFREDTWVAAVFGANDTVPRAPGLVSQYRICSTTGCTPKAGATRKPAGRTRRHQAERLRCRWGIRRDDASARRHRPRLPGARPGPLRG